MLQQKGTDDPSRIPVVVTGAASGIGRSVALHEASNGRLMLCVDLDWDGVRDTVAQAVAVGGDARAYQVDCTDAEAVQRFADSVKASLGWLHGVVACVGGSRGDIVNFLGLSPHAWHDMVDRNLSSAFYTGRFLAPLMTDAGGSIVIVSSQLAQVSRPGFAHYSASKAGLAGLVRGMATDLAPHRIRVNAVAPGPTETPGTRVAFRTPEMARVNRERILRGSIGRPAEIAGPCSFLLSDGAAFITGQVVTADGGYTIT